MEFWGVTMLHKAQVLKCSQRGFAQPKFGFFTNHTNLTKRCRGDLINAYGMSIFVGGTNKLQRREGEAFILASQKLAIGN